MIRSCLITVFALLLAVVSADEVVITANKDNFESIIAADELTLVKFYAPWCGHCKKMAQGFIEAAEELKGKAVLVDLDATVEKDLASKYEVRGFPTLKLFQKGEVLSDYNGDRTKKSLIEYIERSLLPSITECEDSDAVSAFVKESKDKSRHMVFAAAPASPSKYKKISLSIREAVPDTVSFASVSDPALLKDVAGADVAADSIFLVNSDGEVKNFSGTSEELENWIKVATLPVFTELSRENAQVYTENDLPIFLLFQDPDKKDKDINDAVTAIAKEFSGSGSIAFVWINSVELKSFAEHVGVADMSPGIAIYEFKSDTKYIFNEEYSSESLHAWVKKFIAKEVEPSVKSEEIPEKNDEPVKVVVGKSWEAIVEDEEKDVLIEQYAPWCGHCKKLAPILDELAEGLKDVKTLVIAKMDATQNDAPKEYKARGYPTLHFFPAGSKKGVAYEAGRTKEDFVKFFKENATHKEGVELTEKEAEKEEL